MAIYGMDAAEYDDGWEPEGPAPVVRPGPGSDCPPKIDVEEVREVHVEDDPFE